MGADCYSPQVEFVPSEEDIVPPCSHHHLLHLLAGMTAGYGPLPRGSSLRTVGSPPPEQYLLTHTHTNEITL